MTKIGIVGGTGYTGAELIRILALHPEVELCAVTSRQESGRPVADLYPNLRGHVDLTFSTVGDTAFAACDLIFFATPHATAMNEAASILDAGKRVIDLSADFRLRDAQIFEQWYGVPHAAPELLSQAVYGLPEINRDSIRGARLVAAPGCYPTAVTLALLPLVEAGVLSDNYIVADAKSGVSGAGRTPKIGSLLVEAGDSFKAYAAGGHRHQPEIEQNLADAGGRSRLTFVPHLVPMLRGIEATVYAELDGSSLDAAGLQALFEQRYATEPFVDVLPPGSHPETRNVRGSNYCRLAIHRPHGDARVVVLSVIDNLVKGASGQAVQCMNLMLGLDERCGLTSIALQP